MNLKTLPLPNYATYKLGLPAVRHHLHRGTCAYLATRLSSHINLRKYEQTHAIGHIFLIPPIPCGLGLFNGAVKRWITHCELDRRGAVMFYSGQMGRGHMRKGDGAHSKSSSSPCPSRFPDERTLCNSAKRRSNPKAVPCAMSPAGGSLPAAL